MTTTATRCSAIGHIEDLQRKFEMRKLNKSRKLYLSAYLLITCGVAFLLFWHLGAPGISATDEAYHGVNAYEMLKTGNGLVNTYRYEVDYFNSKPPLNLWLIILSYKVFGISPFALRFPAAMAGMLIYLLLSLYLWRSRSPRAALFYGLAFMTNVLPLTYHGFRSGDMDGVFALFYVVAMLALAGIRRHPNAIVVYGLAAGLAFLTKSVHAGIILAVGVLFCLVNRRKLPVKRLAAAVFAMVLPILAWAVPRYLYDGLQFFTHGIAGEMSDKIQTDHVGDVTYPIRLMLLQKNWQLLLACLAAAACVYLYHRRRRGGKMTQPSIMAACRRHALLLCSILVPMGLYLAAQADMEWYYYPSYIGGNVAAALLADYTVESLKKRPLRILYTAGLTVACLAVGVHVARIIYVSDISGDPNVLLRRCIQETVEDWGDTYSGYTAYIENVENSYKGQNEWQCNDVFLAETMMDWQCADGGVEAFLAAAGNTEKNADSIEENTDNTEEAADNTERNAGNTEEDAGNAAADARPSILILSGSLWDQYSSVLTGHVILQDNDYLILSTERY